MKRAKTRKPQPPSVMIMMDLDNPGFQWQHPESKTNPRRATVAVSMFESPVMWMFAHGHVERHQLEAAGAFRRHYEAAGGAGIKAMDTSHEPVDGGNVSDGLTDAKLRASQALSDAHKCLGVERFRIVEMVCGECRWIREIDPRRRTRDAISANLKASLDDLATLWGLAGTGQRKRVA